MDGEGVSEGGSASVLKQTVRSISAVQQALIEVEKVRMVLLHNPLELLWIVASHFAVTVPMQGGGQSREPERHCRVESEGRKQSQLGRFEGPNQMVGTDELHDPVGIESTAGIGAPIVGRYGEIVDEATPGGVMKVQHTGQAALIEQHIISE